jgi:RHS repeat-associated protein
VTRPKEGEVSEIKDTYAYNGEGLRTSQTISGTSTFLAWDMTEGLPLILSDGTNSYIYGPGGVPVEQVSSGGTGTYLHHDQAGSTRLLTGSTGTVTGKCTYGAYGAPTCEGATTTPLGYDAQYTSSDTGLIYMRARVYDPATAQFLNVDPLETLTREPYSYATDNPLNHSDPTGLFLGIPGTPTNGEVVGAIGQHFGQVVAVAAGGTCIVVSAGACAAVIVAGGVLNASVIYANGGSADEQVLNGVATVAGAIPAAALARAAVAASEAGVELLPVGIREGVNAFVGLPGVVAGLLRPSGENSVGC